MANIASCRSCGAVVVLQESGGVCPQCRTPVASDDETKLAVDVEPAPSEDASSASGAIRSRPSVARRSGDSHRRPGGQNAGSGPSSSGWLSSSGAIDHGRFEPGTLLGGRYRIVGRLGRGGMGDVYRADDLKLGQPVALKFLPEQVDADPARLTQLHTEVRMSRQVAHPNVCRVYDIDEIEGHTFLSMEYVDGEDLASLLRRVGRFPEDRALQIARQICAGLAAAHERGIVHRDFKPANIMLDGTGKVRITDFGLAGVSGEAIRAGTPAYMAPEQLAGGRVDARSDIYALGLVLYEIFTGQRALQGGNLAELIHKREQSGIPPPSGLVKDFHPDIERAIMRCLRPHPDDRFSSALAVAATLPGGDPLAAALAAGETPSPEMVAAAGEREAISLGRAVLASLWIGIAIVALVAAYQRVMLINRVPTPKSPDALADRAAESLLRLGYGEQAVDTGFGLTFSQDYVRFIDATSDAPDRWDRLRAERPESLVLWHRTSPRPLVPSSRNSGIGVRDPPLAVGGMTLVAVDASGRLAEFVAVPAAIETAGPQDQPAVDWQVLFDAAGLPTEAFAPSPPQIVPPVFADVRAAWEGQLPNQPDQRLRVEAAAHRGRPVYFVITGPWSRSARDPLASPPLFTRVISSIAVAVMPALMIAAAVLARRNSKLGRGDRRGALRIATVTFGISLAAWILSAPRLGTFEAGIGRFFDAVARALFDAGLLWLAYLGLEPYVRRFSPESLIGWTRLLGGRWRDPRVATDVLIGVSAGLAMTVLYAAHNLLPPLAGRPEPTPIFLDPAILIGTNRVLAHIAGRIGDAISSGMLGVVGVLALTLLLKRRWLGAVAATVCFLPLVVQGMFPPGTPLLDLTLGFGIVSIFVLVIVRFGLLATIAALATHFILLRAPLTTELSTWRGLLSLWYVAVIAIAGLGSAYITYSAGGDRHEYLRSTNHR